MVGGGGVSISICGEVDSKTRSGNALKKRQKKRSRNRRGHLFS